MRHSFVFNTSQQKTVFGFSLKMSCGIILVIIPTIWGAKLFCATLWFGFFVIHNYGISIIIQYIQNIECIRSD